MWRPLDFSETRPPVSPIWKRQEALMGILETRVFLRNRIFGDAIPLNSAKRPTHRMILAETFYFKIANFKNKLRRTSKLIKP